MPEEKKKTVWWWSKLALQGLATTAVAFAPEILQLFPDHTLAFKLAIPAGFLIKWMMVKSDYQKDVLPGGLSDKLDKIPNRFTGVRGSKK